MEHNEGYSSFGVSSDVAAVQRKVATRDQLDSVNGRALDADYEPHQRVRNLLLEVHEIVCVCKAGPSDEAARSAVVHRHLCGAAHAPVCCG